MYRAGFIPSLDKEGWREAPGWFEAAIPQLRSDSYISIGWKSLTVELISRPIVIKGKLLSQENCYHRKIYPQEKFNRGDSSRPNRTSVPIRCSPSETSSISDSVSPGSDEFSVSLRPSRFNRSDRGCTRK